MYTPLALGRSGEIERAVRNGARSHQQHYVDVFDLMQRCNRHMERLLDGRRRSRALTMPARMRSKGLLTEEFASFSQEALGAVEMLVGAR